jgi:hypothetical protein
MTISRIGLPATPIYQELVCGLWEKNVRKEKFQEKATGHSRLPRDLGMLFSCIKYILPLRAKG